MLNTVAEWLRVVVDTAVDGIVLIDSQGDILVFNPASERLFGYHRDEVIGQNVKMLMPVAPRNGHDGHGANGNGNGLGDRWAIGTGREVNAQRKGGITFPIELSVGEAKHGDDTLYVAMIHDISERKQAEAQRERFIEELIASNEERGHFSYVASHDMQEHLRMMLSFNTLLSEEYGSALDDRARQYIGLSLKAAQHLRELVDDLLEFGRLGTETQPSSDFDAGEEVGMVLDVLSSAIRSSDTSISVGTLPTLHANPVRFRRLMQNLISNAMKYKRRDSTPVISVRADDSGAFWRFTVADNGIGIEERHWKRIFEPFKRLHAKNKYSGTGLGLAICKKIVQGFGGEIWVESDPATGSQFHFTIRKKSAA